MTGELNLTETNIPALTADEGAKATEAALTADEGAKAAKGAEGMLTTGSSTKLTGKEQQLTRLDLTRLTAGRSDMGLTGRKRRGKLTAEAHKYRKLTNK
jgi:hypothetical protein